MSFPRHRIPAVLLGALLTASAACKTTSPPPPSPEPQRKDPVPMPMPTPSPIVDAPHPTVAAGLSSPAPGVWAIAAQGEVDLGARVTRVHPLGDRLLVEGNDGWTLLDERLSPLRMGVGQVVPAADGSRFYVSEPIASVMARSLRDGSEQFVLSLETSEARQWAFAYAAEDRVALLLARTPDAHMGDQHAHPVFEQLVFDPRRTPKDGAPLDDVQRSLLPLSGDPVRVAPLPPAGRDVPFVVATSDRVLRLDSHLQVEQAWSATFSPLVLETIGSTSLLVVQASGKVQFWALNERGERTRAVDLPEQARSATALVRDRGGVVHIVAGEVVLSIPDHEDHVGRTHFGTPIVGIAVAGATVVLAGDRLHALGEGESSSVLTAFPAVMTAGPVVDGTGALWAGSPQHVFRLASTP